MHLAGGEGSRIVALARTVFYLIGAPIFLDNYYNGSTNQTNLAMPDTMWLFTDSSEWTDVDRGDCYEALGCFKTRYSEEKGYDIRPNSLEEVMPTICLHTKKNLQPCQVVEAEVISTSTLEVSNGSIFWIAHGYIENGQRPWIKEMVHELLEYDNFASVFVVDWSEASKPPYNQAVENLEMIAAHCANIMVAIEENYGMAVRKIHWIGHSLGSQMGGYVGTWLQEHRKLNLGRISGLDPAQLYFDGLPSDARLDQSDALFVDIIHTDAKPFLNGGPVSGLGTQEPSGHSDFFPNGGKDQPGCKDGVYQAILQEEGSVINGIRRFLGCDHIRSYEYFTESIRSHCPFKAFSCKSWQDFTDSTCMIAHYNRLGFHAEKPSAGNASLVNGSVLYYSMTGPRSPFCRDHYRVTIRLAQESQYRSTSELHLVLGNNTNGNGQSSVLNLGTTDFTGKDLEKNYTVSGINKGLPKFITLRPSSSNPLRWLMTKATVTAEPDVVVASVTINHLELMEEGIKFCPEKKNYFSITEQNPSISLSSETCR